MLFQCFNRILKYCGLVLLARIGEKYGKLGNASIFGKNERFKEE